MSTPSRGPLPFMKSLEDAVAVCEKEQDNFYVTAFMIEAWLGGLTLDTVTEYAEKKSAIDRRLQTGRARQLFDDAFGHAEDEDILHILGSICRFGEYDDPQSEMILQAFAILSFEEPTPKPPEHPLTREEALAAVARARRMVARLCDWLEAIVHWQTHHHYHLSPVSFDPDPERRELAILGVNQRCFSHMSDFGKTWWQWHHDEAAERFKDSPKWPTIGKAMASDQQRRHEYPELDQLFILLWPLLKRDNWTYRDLLNVTQMIAPQPFKYPCEREQDLAAYCPNVLGLRKDDKGKSDKSGRPVGYEIALRICGREVS